MAHSDVFMQPSKSPEKENDQAISQLRQQLLSYCEFLSGSPHDAQDLVQTTMQRALPVLQGAQEHPNLTALLRRIARNAWVDQTRKEAKYQLCDLTDWSALAGVDAPDRFPVEEALLILIQRLTPQQRAVILLCDVFQYTDGEASELLGVSRGAVKSALHRARTRLQSITEHAEITYGDESQKGILEAYVSAFQAADIRMLVHLCLDGTLSPVLATTKALILAQSQARQPAANRANNRDFISMFAASSAA